MALPNSTNDVTSRKLGAVIDNLWTKIKSTFQTQGNLVTSWSSTASNTKYPSEKLVKDSLDGKADLANTSQAILTEPSQNEGAKYLIVSQTTFGGSSTSAWMNYDLSMIIQSRHSGTGLAVIQCNANTGTPTETSVTGTINIFTTTTSVRISSPLTMYRKYDESTYKWTITVVVKCSDYNTFKIKSILAKNGLNYSTSCSYVTDLTTLGTQIATALTASNSNHTHGNITNAGALQTTDIAIANGDKLVVTDSSNSSKVARTSLSFDGSTTTKALTPKGTWESFAKSSEIPAAANNGALQLQLNGGTATSKFTANQSGNSTLAFATGSSNGTISVDGTDIAVKGLGGAAYLNTGTASGTVATGNHTHTTSIASDSSSGTVVTLAHNTQYKLTAGGTSVLFKTPADSNTDTKVTQTKDDSSTGTGFEVLFSETADNTTRTEASRKSSKLTFQPSTGTLTATKFSGPLTGNVTGNCSGSSGSCTGNAATATTATNASITRTADTTNGDKLQIGTGTAVNITNAKHAASADSASKVTNKLTLKIKTGSTEGTNLYTYDGSAAKTLDIKQGSNITLTAAAGSLTIAGTDTKNTVGVGAASHAYDNNYYVPFTTSTQSAASNAQSYTELTGEMETRTPLLRFVDDPIKGMQGFMAGNQIGRFNGVPPETADGKLITVGMDGQLIVSSILETDVALSSNVEPLLTVGRKVIKTGSGGEWNEVAPEPNGEILGFNCSKTASNNRDGFGIALNVNGTMTGGLTFTETVNGTKSTSYILAYANGAITGGKKFHFYGSSDYAITAGTAVSAGSAGSATNVALTGSVKTTSTSNGDTIQFQAGSGTAGTVTIVNAKHAASADSATSASYLKDATNTSRTAKVSYYGSGAISGSNAVQYLAGFYTPDGSSSSTICDVPHAKMLMYIFGQLYSSRCKTINSNHTLSLSDFSNNAEGSLYMYQNVTAASKTLTWTYRHTQGTGTATGTVEKGCTAVFILDDATNAVFTRIM